MESNTQSTPPSAEEIGLPPGAPEPVRAAAVGKDVDAEGEATALDFFLGATYRPKYRVRVDFETPMGMKPLTFHLQALDDREIQRIDTAHRKDTESPFAKLDSTSFNSELLVEATAYVTDESGRKVEPKSTEFMGQIPDPILAMEMRFKFQPGLMDGIAEQIRKLSAYDSSRVGAAQRVLVDAAGGS